MDKKLVGFSIFFISVFLVTGIFAQTYFLSSTVPSSEEESASTKTADYNQDYNFPDGSIMNILSTDVSDNTITTLNNGTETLPIDSTFTEGQTGNSKTVINNTYEVSTDNSNKTKLVDKDSNFNVTVDNGFNPHAVDSIQAEDYTGVGKSDVSASATRSNQDDTYLESFNINENGDNPWTVNYNWDYLTDTEVFNVNETVLIVTSVDWIMIQLGPFMYNVSLITGDVFWSNDGGFTWNPVLGNIDTDNYIYYDLSGITFVYANGTIIVTDGLTWEIIIFTFYTLSIFYWKISIYCLFLDFYIIWVMYSLITIYWGVWVYIFYLWIFYELLFVFIYIDYDWKIEYYSTYIVIVWVYIVITIWFLDIYIHWVIIFWWEWWVIKIQWYYYYYSYWFFIDYIFWIQYRYTIYNFIYIYYVPTPVLPNLLFIDIIDAVYTNITFDIRINVKDSWGNLVNDAIITGLWNSVLIGSVTNNGDGTYDFSLAAILVAPLDPGILLSLTASKMGYTDGNLDTEIAVDPEAVNKEPTPSVDGGGLIPGPSLVLIGLFSIIATVFVGKHLTKKRKILQK